MGKNIGTALRRNRESDGSRVAYVRARTLHPLATIRLTIHVVIPWETNWLLPRKFWWGFDGGL
jgi:hypothetical protein